MKDYILKHIVYIAISTIRARGTQEDAFRQAIKIFPSINEKTLLDVISIVYETQQLIPNTKD